MLLEIKDVSVSYGAIQAVRQANLAVSESSIVALLGPNGAGKSSLLNAISGLAPVVEGRIIFDGVDITDLTTEKRAKMGISEVLEGRRIFRSLTVEENLLLATTFRCAGGRHERREAIERTYDQFSILSERRKKKAASLSGGQLQILIFAVATISDPKLLLLDEPSLGLAPLMVKEIYSIVEQLNKQGTTILLAEQLASVALGAASYAYILERGKVSTEGTSSSLKGELGQRGLASSYLGGS